MQNIIKHFRADRFFYLFICIHLIAWTLAPAIVRYNLPLDSIEGTIWGHQLEWGYDKNPFLNGWLTALATYIDGHQDWMVYLFSQLSVVICFWVVWRLAKTMLSPAYALISVMLLEGIQYFNFHSIDFNDNTLELSLWALTIYFFYHALRKPTTLLWILTGVFAGLGMMAKYYTLALIAALALFLFMRAENRKQLTTLPPYVGLLAFIAVITPHTIWLFFHDFITVRYVFERTDSTPSWTNHFFFPAQFAWQQWEVFIPAIVLYIVLLLGKRPALSKQETKISAFDRSFLFYASVMPFLLTLILSLVLGIKLRAGWGMPLLSFWGLLLVALLPPYLTKAKIYRFLSVTYIFMAVLLTGYTISLVHSKDTSSANFPGREIATTITKLWHDTYHTDLAYVAGSRWISGNISFYSKDSPAVFIRWDKLLSPWIEVKKMQEKGAVFVWDESNDESLPKEVKNQFANLSKTQTLTFNWYRNKHDLAPIKLGIAFLPPKS